MFLMFYFYSICYGVANFENNLIAIRTYVYLPVFAFCFDGQINIDSTIHPIDYPNIIYTRITRFPAVKIKRGKNLFFVYTYCIPINDTTTVILN